MSEVYKPPLDEITGSSKERTGNWRNIIKKVYDIGYRNLMYAIGFSSAAGLGNACKDPERFSELFGQGYVNHFKLSIIGSLSYVAVTDYLKKSKHQRLYSNLFHTGVFLTTLCWHYFAGTENPIETMIPTGLAGYIMINNNLEGKINDKSTID